LSSASLNNWKDVEAEVLSRIRSRQWEQGELIPNELDRRRKAGTRVTKNPARKATLSIPVIREEIESRNQTYSHLVISSKLEVAPLPIQAQLGLRNGGRLLHHQSLHLANGAPYVASDRWVNVDAIPEIVDVDFTNISANEWLVANALFTRGDISFSATEAEASIAKLLNAKVGEALFTIDRTTWNQETAVTSVRLVYHQGYRLHTTI